MTFWYRVLQIDLKSSLVFFYRPYSRVFGLWPRHVDLDQHHMRICLHLDAVLIQFPSLSCQLEHELQSTHVPKGACTSILESGATMGLPIYAISGDRLFPRCVCRS